MTNSHSRIRPVLSFTVHDGRFGFKNGAYAFSHTLLPDGKLGKIIVIWLKKGNTETPPGFGICTNPYCSVRQDYDAGDRTLRKGTHFCDCGGEKRVSGIHECLTMLCGYQKDCRNKGTTCRYAHAKCKHPNQIRIVPVAELPAGVPFSQLYLPYPLRTALHAPGSQNLIWRLVRAYRYRLRYTYRTLLKELLGDNVDHHNVSASFIEYLDRLLVDYRWSQALNEPPAYNDENFPPLQAQSNGAGVQQAQSNGEGGQQAQSNGAGGQQAQSNGASAQQEDEDWTQFICDGLKTPETLVNPTVNQNRYFTKLGETLQGAIENRDTALTLRVLADIQAFTTHYENFDTWAAPGDVIRALITNLNGMAPDMTRDQIPVCKGPTVAYHLRLIPSDIPFFQTTLQSLA